jgi:hypothetical protein
LELISHVRGSTRSGSSGKRRFDEVVSLLAEANEAGLEFDELQQLSVYESQCSAWRLKAESVVKDCCWLNVTCSSLGDDNGSDGDDAGASGSQEEESGPEDNAANSSCDMHEGGDHDGPAVVDAKEVFKSSWWMTDDIKVCVRVYLCVFRPSRSPCAFNVTSCCPVPALLSGGG